MPNIVNLANHIVVSTPPGPTVPDSKHSAEGQNADIDHADPFPPDTSRPLDPQEQATGAPRLDDDSISTDQVGETDAGNFREVLEKRLSQKSDTQPESEKYQTTSDFDESHHVIVALPAKGVSKTGVKPKGTAPGRTHLLSKAALAARGSAKGQPLQAQLKSTQNTGGPTMPSHNVIVALPGKEATETEVKPKGTASGWTHLLSKAAPATRGFAKGQPFQAEQLKTDAPAAQGSEKGQPIQAQLKSPQTTGGPTMPSHHVIVALPGKGASNTEVKPKGTAPGRTHLLSKAAPATRGFAKGQEQLKNDAPAAQGSAKGQPLQAEQLKTGAPAPKAQKATVSSDITADILPENAKADALLATAKLSPTDPKNAAIASTNRNGTPQGGTKGVRTAPGKNQTLAASNSAQSATQKDTTEIQAAPAAARTNEVIADTDGSNPATVEVTALGAKAPNVSSALTASRPNSANNAPQTAAGTSSGGIQTAGNMQQSTADQIIDSIRLNIDSPQQQINISLNPPELGRVRIMFRQIDGEITGLLGADKRQTKYDIEQSLPQIVASLQQCGVQVGRVNVILNDQNQQEQLKNNDMPDDDFVGMDKHGFTDQSSDDNPTRPNSPQADTAGHVTRQPSNITNEITDDTINVYV